jgi:bifunctional non-homologous end joining protein LigD
MIQGAKPSEMPGFIAPQLAASRSKAPTGERWLHEMKYDGYRVQLHVNKQRRTIFTRGGLDWTKRFSVISGAFDVPVERAILDGEIVVVKDGRTSFSELQAELAKGNQDSLLFYAFDLLYLEGFDLIRNGKAARAPINNKLPLPTYVQRRVRRLASEE